MTVLAYGAENVQALEGAIGGKPPAKAADQPLAALKRHMREGFERCKASRAAMGSLLERAQAPLIELVKPGPAAAESVERRRNLIVGRRKEKPSGKHARVKIEPRMLPGSGFWLKALPYDRSFQSAVGGAIAFADVNAGVYSLPMSGDGGSAAASAGLGA